MEDKAPDFIEFDEPKMASLPKTENVLKLDDPPEKDHFSSLNAELSLDINSEKNDCAVDCTEPLLTLAEPPAIENCDDTMIQALGQLAEKIEPIISEAIENYKSMMDYESVEVPNETGIDKKSEKSSSDDGFEYVKEDEVVSKRTVSQINEAEELQRDLENIVIQEKLKLENATEQYANCGSYDGSNNDDKEIEESVIKEENAMEEAKTDEINVELTNEAGCETESTDMQILDSLAPGGQYETFDEECNIETSFQDNLKDEEPVESHFSSIKLTDDNSLCNKFKDIVTWSNPILSALVFSGLMFIELGLILEYSVISMLAYSGIILLFFNFFYRMAVCFQLIETSSPRNCIMAVNKEDVEHCVNVTLDWVKYVHKEVVSIIEVESFAKNFKVLTLLWILTYVGQLFNLQSLIFIGSLLLFSVPVVYKQYSEQIDSLLGNMWVRVNGPFDKIKSKFSSS